MAVIVVDRAYEGGRQGADKAAFPPAPGVRDLEGFLQLEPAEEPVLSFSEEGLIDERLAEPSYLYQDLLLRSASAAVRLRSSTDMPLPSINSQVVQKDFWENSDTGLGVLAREALISTATGCWAIPNAYRNNKGYSYTWDVRKYGLEPRGKGEYKGMQLHQVAFILRMQIEMPEYVMPASHTLEHVCRNVKQHFCCVNPYHFEYVTQLENNRLQRKAHPIESALFVGQLMLAPTGYNYIDAFVGASEKEDTGLVVSTRFGPFRIIKVEDEPVVFRGEPEPERLANKVRPPAKENKYVSGEDLTLILNGQKPMLKPKRKSRAKLPVPIAGQKTIPPLKGEG